MNIVIKVILICFICLNMLVNMMMLGLKSGPQIAAKTGIPAGLLFRRIWYSVWKSGVLGITEYRQGRPLRVSLADGISVKQLCCYNFVAVCYWNVYIHCSFLQKRRQLRSILIFFLLENLRQILDVGLFLLLHLFCETQSLII